MKRAIRLNSHFGRILGKGILANDTCICSQRTDALFQNFRMLRVINTSGLSRCPQAYC